MSESGPSIPWLLLVVVVVISVAAGAAAAVTVVTLDVNNIAPGSGDVSGSTNIDLDSQSLVYDGTNVTAVDVVVNNTDSTSHTVTVHAALSDSSGTSVGSGTNSSVSVPANDTVIVRVTLDNAPGVDEFKTSDVTAEETA